MKIKNLLIITLGLTLFCCACTKNSQLAPVKAKPVETALDTAFTTGSITASIIGKWYVNKERRQILKTKTGIITDTTYNASFFTSGDFYEFNSDSTATFTQGTTFFSASVTQVSGSTKTVYRTLFTYKVSGPTLTIAYKYGISLPSSANPGPYPETIVQLDANNLVIHGVMVDGTQKIVLDVYLTKGG